MREVERSLHYNVVEVGMDPMEKCRAGLTKLIVPDYDSRGVPAFQSLGEAYAYLTGDPEISGVFRPRNVAEDLRARADFSSASFAYALQNALNVHLSKQYKSFPYREEILISDKKKATDFRKIHSVQLGYFEDLPEIDPEAGNYESLGNYVDSEAWYRINQKGAVIFVTRRMIINNSVDLAQDLSERMARAARKTHARYVWNFYITNAACPDGTAWFTVAHGNLGTLALTFTNLVAAITALADMEEPSPSEEKIGLDLATFNWHLVVPTDMWADAVGKNQEQYYYTSNDLTTKSANPCYRLFGDRNERIITPPFLTDSDDWGVIRDKEDVPIVEMSYLNGKEDPEFILEIGPTEEHVFKSDMLGYKIRHEYGGNLVDYRGGYKAIVP